MMFKTFRRYRKGQDFRKSLIIRAHIVHFQRDWLINTSNQMFKRKKRKKKMNMQSYLKKNYSPCNMPRYSARAKISFTSLPMRIKGSLNRSS